MAESRFIIMNAEPTGRESAELPAAARTGMGIVTYALGIHARQQWSGRHDGLTPARAFLEECLRLGAGGMQFDLGVDPKEAAGLRQRAEQPGLYLEGIVSPPRSDADLDRFEKQIEAAQEAGAGVARTVIMPGRRYEEFPSLEAFRQAESAGVRSLERAEPVLARHRFRLAVENHKDHRVEERVRMFGRLGREWIGACVDVGNNLALLDDPLETVRAFTPWAMTVHIKDHAVRDYDGGFLLADMALGEGFLDLKEMIRILRVARPGIRFNLEVITRDALEVPVGRPGYWATFPDLPARDLARTLGMVKSEASPAAFPAISKLSPGEQLAAEARNVEVSLSHARSALGL